VIAIRSCGSSPRRPSTFAAATWFPADGQLRGSTGSPSIGGLRIPAEDVDLISAAGGVQRKPFMPAFSIKAVPDKTIA
jgi:hypothetical protein